MNLSLRFILMNLERWVIRISSRIYKYSWFSKSKSVKIHKIPRIHESSNIHVSIKIRNSPGTHESLDMYDIQNIEFARSHTAAIHGPSYSHTAKQRIRLCGTCQEVSKVCISWHHHISCYAKKQNNNKLYEAWQIHASLEIRKYFEIYESYEIYEFFETRDIIRDTWFLEIHLETLQPRYRFIESGERFIPNHESESVLCNTKYNALKLMFTRSLKLCNCHYKFSLFNCSFLKHGGL